MAKSRSFQNGRPFWKTNMSALNFGIFVMWNCQAWSLQLNNREKQNKTKHQTTTKTKTNQTKKETPANKEANKLRYGFAKRKYQKEQHEKKLVISYMVENGFPFFVEHTTPSKSLWHVRQILPLKGENFILEIPFSLYPCCCNIHTEIWLWQYFPWTFIRHKLNGLKNCTEPPKLHV